MAASNRIQLPTVMPAIDDGHFALQSNQQPNTKVHPDALDQ